MRIMVTADLHLEVTGLEPIRRLVAGIEREEPDAVVLAGDLGHPLGLFEQCLTAFLPLACPVAVLPGNHDLWTSPGVSSVLLYEEVLPEITKSMGFHWLEHGPMLIPDARVAICGNIGWYDYSSQEPRWAAEPDVVAARKAEFAADADRIDWEYDDITFARLCRERLARHMNEAEQDARVDRVLLVTHVPVFESQVDRRPDDRRWSMGNPYFGHLTMGNEALRFGKMRWCVSGHTHVGMNGVQERAGAAPVATAVVDSSYGKPRWVVVDTDESA
jgi:predicted MPP superfamily phosphohydrolase